MEGTRSEFQACPQCGRHSHSSAGSCGACGTLLATAPTASASAPARRRRTAPPAPAGALAAGTPLGHQGRYRVEALLGQGGFGEAYLAYDAQLGRHCVVKRLTRPAACLPHRWKRLCDDFRHEARLLVSLNAPGHPNIPEIYDYLDEHHCLVMKYVEGQSLAEALDARGGPLPEDEALRCCRDACAALVYMHGRAPDPVLHRDIKPSNILRDGTGRIWLIDFGLAKALPAPTLAGAKQASQAAGTPGYTPVEQWRGAAVPASDVYALTATLYTLVTARPPLAAATDDQTLRRLNPSIAPELAQLIRRGMAPEPAARPTAAELLMELDVLLGPPVPAPPEPTRPPDPPELVGRVAELARLSARLAERRVVVLTGMAGIGKTALAATLAYREAEPDEIFWHIFHQDEGVDDVIWKLAAFLARRGHATLWRQLHTPRLAPPPEALCDALVDLLRGRRCLLCFDDVQWAEGDPLVARLLRALLREAEAGPLRLLLASRSLPGFVQPGAAAALAGLSGGDARALLERQALALPDALAERIASAVEGNAQLLLLASEALRQTADPTQLVGHLVGADNIEHYLLYEVDKHLTEHERAVMGALSALLGHSGTADAVEALLDQGGVGRALADLSRRALVQVSTRDDDRQYGQHAILRAFYYGMLGARARRAMHGRAGAYYEAAQTDPILAARHYERAGEPARAAALATADVAAAINRGQARTLDQLLAQLPTERLDPSLAAATHTARGEVAALLGDYALARAQLEQALRQEPLAQDLGGPLPAGGPLAEAQARRYRLLALVGERTGDYGGAEEACRQGLALVAAPGRRSSEAARLYAQLAEVAWRRGQFEAVEQACQAGLAALAPGPGALREQAALHQRLALVHGGRGHYAAAINGLEGSLAMARQGGDLTLTAAVLHNLGMYALRVGQRERALACYAESLQLKEQIGDVAGRVRTLINQSSIYQERGEYDLALRGLDEARVICRRLNLVEPLAAVLSNSGIVQFLKADLDGAAASFHDALDIDTTLDNPVGIVDSLYRLGDVALARGDAIAAQGYGERALLRARQVGSAAYESCAGRVLGEAQLQQGHVDAATASLAQSWQLQQAVGDPYDQTLLLLAMAQLALAQDDPALALARLDAGLELAREHELPHLVATLEARRASINGEGAR